MSEKLQQLSGRDDKTGLAGPRSGPGPTQADPSAAHRTDHRVERPGEAASPVFLTALSLVLAAAGASAGGAALLLLGSKSSLNLPAGLLLGFALVVLLALAFCQYRARRGVIALTQDWQRAHELARINSAVIASFAMAIDAKDQHTHGHTERVRQIARLMGEDLGFSDDELQALETAAMLHDIGKLAVPDYILSKPGHLTPEEMKKVETHTLVGAAILEPVQFPWPVIPIIRSHHEWYDGTGYPDGLAGDQIPLAARILTVADVYDALLSHRPYRPAMTVQDAVTFLRERSGTQFDADILNTCFRVLAAQQASNRFGFIFDASSLPQAAQDTPGRRAIFMDIRQAHQELLALYEIVQTMGRSLNVQETLDLIISKTKPIIDFATCVIFLRHTENGDLQAMAASGPYSDLILGRRLPMGSGVSGRVAQQGVSSGLGAAAGDDLVLLLGPTALKCALTEVLSAPLGCDDEAEPAQAEAAAEGLGESSLSPDQGPPSAAGGEEGEAPAVSSRPIGALTLYRASDRPFTEDDARLIVAVAGQASSAINNARQQEQTRQTALTDELTGLANARYFFMHLDQELSRARRDKTPVSLLAIDLNNLKQINDNFGHQQGDRALRTMAEVSKRYVRDYDTVVRYAGDEFFIILPDTTNQKAVETANRIKRGLREAGLQAGGRGLALSASFGVATFPGDAKDPDGLIAFADRAMYSDKNLSRQAALLSQTAAPREAGPEPPPAAAEASPSAPGQALAAVEAPVGGPGPRKLPPVDAEGAKPTNRRSVSRGGQTDSSR